MKALPWLLADTGDLKAGHTVVLDPAEARHLSGPLRRRVGDEVVLTDGGGRVAGAHITSVAKTGIEVEITAVQRHPTPPLPGVTVALAVISSRSMDWAVQKAVEIGVQRFLPLETDRTQIRGAAVEARVDHWRRISMQALKQCRRAWAMEVEEVVSIRQLMERSQLVGIIADREGPAIGELPEGTGNLLVVGPEGGFSAQEDELLERYRWPRLRLGPHVLRAETAAIVGGAMLVARSESG